MDGLEGDVMEAGEEVGTTDAVVSALGALIRVHQRVVALLIGVESVGGAVRGGDTDQSSIVVELEGVTLTETIDNSDHGKLVGLEVEGLVDGVVGDLEGERVEPSIRDNLNVLQPTMIMMAGLVAATMTGTSLLPTISCLLGEDTCAVLLLSSRGDKSDGSQNE